MEKLNTLPPAAESAPGLSVAPGSEFEAHSGKAYARWRVDSEVLRDATGVPFVWCVPVYKICGGYLRKRSRHVWPLHMIPNSVIQIQDKTSLFTVRLRAGEQQSLSGSRAD